MNTVYLTTLEGRRTPTGGTMAKAVPLAGNSEFTLTLQGECVCTRTLSGAIDATYYVDGIELHGLNLGKMFKIKPARFKLKLKPNLGKMFKIKPGRFKIKTKLNLGSLGKKIGNQFDKLLNTRGVSRFMKRNLDVGKFVTRAYKPVSGLIQQGLEMSTGLLDKLIPGAGGILGQAGEEALEQGEQFLQDEAAGIQEEADAAISEALSSVDGMLQQFVDPVEPGPAMPDMSSIIGPALPFGPAQPKPAPAPPPQVITRSTDSDDTTTMLMIGGGALVVLMMMGNKPRRSRRRAA